MSLVGLVIRSRRLDDKEEEEVFEAGGAGLAGGCAALVERRTGDGMVSGREIKDLLGAFHDCSGRGDGWVLLRQS